MRKLLIIILTFIVCSCNNLYEENIQIEKNTFNVFENIYLNDLVDNTITLEDNIKLDTETIGEKEIMIKYQKNNKNYISTYKYNVIDTVKPTLINVPSTQTTLINEEINLCDKAIFVDNYDREVTCEIEGTYDISKLGKYDLKYIIKDSSNNIISKNLTLKVVEKLEEINNKNKEKKQYNFNDALKYKNNDTMIGIDISRYQGEIDFEKIKNAGVEFVMMRIGIQSGYKKELAMDTYYEQNIKKAKEANLKVGVYLYSTALNEETAKEQALWVINTLNGISLDFPIAFDWENWLYMKEYKISLHDLSKTYKSFKKQIEENGYESMLYGSTYYLENMWLDIDDEKIWLAHYTDKTNYTNDYIMWQFTNVGVIEGINGYVDFDIYYKK